MHPELIEILNVIRNEKINSLIITTNGYYIKKSIIKEIKNLNFKDIVFQVSLDSCNENIHNNFRGNNRSFIKALNSIDLLSKEGFFTSTRTTLTYDTLNEKRKSLNLLDKKGQREYLLEQLYLSVMLWIINYYVLELAKRKNTLMSFLH